MGLYQSWASVLLVTIVILKLLHSSINAARLRRIMPPGPPGLPFLGNIFQARGFAWLKFTEWKDQYGPIFSLNVAGQPVVVLNDFETTAELIDRRSNIYSSRPRFVMASQIMTGGIALAFIPYNALWRRLHRAAHDGFSPRASATYQPSHERESLFLALDILDDPEHWAAHLQRSFASTMLDAVYGWSLHGAHDAGTVVEDISDIGRRVAHAALPGSYLVDFLPALRRLPGWLARWRREGRRCFERDTRLFAGLLGGVQDRMRAGASEPCFATTLLENEEKYHLSKEETAWLAGIMFVAGVETTSGAMIVFMLAMVLHPDVMRRAQAQLDAVVGRGRPPSFGDRARLPYIEAMVKEVLRWRPIDPLGVARRTTQDDWYKGYFIPKNTIVLLNVWSMNRDPKYFPNYDEFRPERYLDDLGHLSEPVPYTHNEGHISFGAGRRICMGKSVANQALFMDIATLLWAFDIGKAVDGCGQPVTPSRTDCVAEGIAVHPAPFECSIKPRSPETAAIIRSVAENIPQQNRIEAA